MATGKQNQIQFSTVREDPEVEIELFREYNLKKPILIGSGGCTAFSLASYFPEMSIELIEPNPAQVKLIQEKAKKIKKLKNTTLAKMFGVGRASTTNTSMIEQGNFESLFRQLRKFIGEFVVSEKDLTRLLKSGTKKDWNDIFKHPYWSVAFNLFFSNSILETMFGPAAIQHAPAESYSLYFKNVIEKGLLRKDHSSNYFLYHILLGYYPNQKSAWPFYLQKPPRRINIKIFNGTVQEYPDFSKFDFVGLSNIFDWSSEAEVKEMAQQLSLQLNPGSFVLYRQLNNRKDFKPFFGQDFKWLDSLAQDLQKSDRSLFYSSIHIARREK